jgi:hypothetical protein
MIPQFCPKCSTELVEGKPDGNGKPWYFCDDCGTFVHQYDLDEAADKLANWQDAMDDVDNLATMDGLLPDLQAAIEFENECQRQVMDSFRVPQDVINLS